MHTRDGGNTWERQQSNTTNFLDGVFFLDTSEGWVVGGGGVVLHTTDGGQNWRPQWCDTKYDLKAIHMTSSKRGWIVGNLGIILEYVVE